MIVCARCGEENPDRARFCLACATPLSQPAPQQEERKVVSVLFVDLVGSTAAADAADPEDVRATLAPYHARVRVEIERFGGTVEKFVGDAVMAIFGAPVAHEDDAERAVRAGLRVLEATNELSLRARAAVNTGEALVALGARPELGEAQVAGDVVNTASRLQAAAGVGELVVGELTYRTTREQIDYEPLGSVSVKGKAEPVALWRARGAHSRFGVDVEIGGTTPFVGRDSELALLRETYARIVRENAVQLVTIVGEPGLGKTRLLREFGRWLDDRPDLVYWRQGRCLPYGEGITFWALGEIVKAHAGILETDDAKAATTKLAASVQQVVSDATEQEWIRARLAPLVGVAGEAATPGREESFTAWRGYLEGIASQRPLVVLVEDLHWADDALLEFLDHLLDWSLGVPLLVLCTGRPELYERHGSWGGGKRNSTTVSLSALPPTETARLVHALLDETVLPAETQALLLERCGGNPLYAEQFARMLGDRTATEVGVPETVQAVIAARLDALGPSRKGLLHDAAVIGKVFWAEAVSALDGREPREVLQTLVELAHRDLVRPARTSSLEGRREFSFTHLLVRDVAYGQIPRAERVRKHRLAAEWIEQTVGERAADHAELLAHHYTEALELGRAAGVDEAELEPLRAAAVRTLVAAADRASELDVESAAQLLERALELANVTERPRVLVKSAEAAMSLGQLAEARVHLDEAIPALRHGGADGALAEGLSHLSYVEDMAGDSAAAQAAGDEAAEIAAAAVPDSTIALVYVRHAGNLMLNEQSEECLTHCERVWPVVEAFGDARQIDMLHQFRGISRVATGDLSGLDEIRATLENSLATGTGNAIAGFVNLGYWTWWSTGPAAGAELFRGAMDAASRRGVPNEWSETELTWALFDLGEWDEALARCDHVLETAAGRGAVIEAMSRPTRGRILLARGRLGEARADAQAVAALVGETRIPQALVPSLTLAAAVAVADGDRTRAAALLGDLEERTRGRVRSRGIELAEGARTAAAAGDVTPIQRILAEPHPPLPRASAQWASAEAVLAEAAGDVERGLRGYRYAASAWETFGHPFEQAHALLGAGRCASALGAHGAAELGAARGLFATLGATAFAAEVDTLLGRAAAAGS